MKIFVTGGTGFVGRSLAPALVRSGHGVTILTRTGKEEFTGVSWVKGDPTKKGRWQDALSGHEAVINLAGASIFTRWTEEAKKIIRDSRILTTRNIVEALEGGRGKTLFSTSAIGYYGFHGDEALSEEAPPGGDFLALLAKDWEEEAKAAERKGCRVVIPRFGIVLGEKRGALGQMIPLFRKYLGGPLGSGKQWFSWIHLVDLVRAYLFLLDHPEISGPVNFTAPHPVRNKELSQWLGKILGRPAFLPAPGFMLRLVLGEFGSILLEGQKVVPQKLLRAGFEFQYPEIAQALRQVVQASGY
ncbi:MAG: TIGR01777 family protein [Syntrophaceae bacterium]|nr:TIGR01777 family protein [Syntrophaceae bacterium]